MNRCLLVVVLASVWIAGCGGKVDEDLPTVVGADAGADGATGGGQGGAGGGSSGCALPPGRPEYPHCYPSLGGSCLEPSETTKLVEKLPALSGQKVSGPWVARMEDACTPACCYGPLRASSRPVLSRTGASVDTLVAVRPQRIILLRHGQAEGNVDETIFERKPDHRLELTPKGVAESIAAGKDLATLLAGEPVAVYVSPYVRTWQTYEALRDAIHVTQVREEPRLREQDWGNYQDGARIATQKAERDTFGHFFYRFERGESGSDVYDRVSTFFETLHRDFHADDFPPNALLITHGLTMRLFLMRWFHWTVPYFESLENPRNCERRVLQRGPDGRYTLDEPLPRWK